MENLFITNSKFNLEKLKENKAFLLNLVSQIKEAYIIGFYKESDYKDITEIEIGSYRDEYDNHKFSVNGNGVVSFLSASLRMPTNVIKDLVKKYPESYTQMHPIDSWINLEINNINKKNINNVIKDIVLAFESSGHAPAFTLRR